MGFKVLQPVHVGLGLANLRQVNDKFGKFIVNASVVQILGQVIDKLLIDNAVVSRATVTLTQAIPIPFGPRAGLRRHQ